LAAASDDGSTHLHATAVAANYSSAPVIGPAQLITEVRRVGRGVSFVHVTLVQGDRVETEAVVTLGTLRDSASRYMDAHVPEVAPLEECVSLEASEESIHQILDLRLDPSCTGFMTGTTSNDGQVTGWMRLNDGDASWDPWSLLFAADAMPPATFPLGSSGWVPTLQMTTYVRRIPVGEWLRARQWCVVVADDLVDERCDLFDERGELVASSSQLAMVRFRASH
jgi:acyl-CoA thioesterase